MISRQMAQQWVPEFCRFYQLQRIGRFWHPRAAGEEGIAGTSGTNIWSQIAGQFGQEEIKQQKPKIA